MEVIPYPRMDFRALGIFLRKIGTSLKKFGTFNPRATETPISFPMVHLFIYELLGSYWRSFFAFETNFGTLGKSLIKFFTSLRKFSTSNPRATRTLIFLPMVHLFF